MAAGVQLVETLVIAPLVPVTVVEVQVVIRPEGRASELRKAGVSDEGSNSGDIGLDAEGAGPKIPLAPEDHRARDAVAIEAEVEDGDSGWRRR